MAFNSMPYGPRIVYILRRSDMRDPFEDGQPAPFYVGQGRSNRIYMHLWEAHNTQKNTRKLNIIRAVERNGGVITADIIALDLPYDVGLVIEQQLIEFYGRDTNGGLLANRTKGGEGVSDLPEETRIRIAEAKRGKKRSPETIEKMRKGRMGFRHSEATKVKISQIVTGRKHTAEARAKMSLAIQRILPTRRPAVLTPESLAHKKAILTGRKYPEMGMRNRGGGNPAARALLVDGQRYGSVKDAASALGMQKDKLHMLIHRGDPRFQYVPGTEDIGSKLGGIANPRAHAVRINGAEYATVGDAIIALKIGKTTFYRRVRKGIYLLEDVE